MLLALLWECPVVDGSTKFATVLQVMVQVMVQAVL